MSQVSTPHHVLLSQSYRFGPAIATAATAILRSLGAKHPVRGLEAIQSHLALVHPQVILSRTNAGVIGNVLKCLYCRMPCHVLGGTSGLEILLTDVRRVKQGKRDNRLSFSRSTIIVGAPLFCGIYSLMRSRPSG